MIGTLRQTTRKEVHAWKTRRVDDRFPPGSGLVLACLLGLVGWYGITRLIELVAHALP